MCVLMGAAARRGFEEALAAEGHDGEKQAQRVRSLFQRQLQVMHHIMTSPGN